MTEEKKPAPKKKPEPKKRRSQKEIAALVQKVNELVAGGMAATAACEKLGLGYQSYTLAMKKAGAAPASGKDEIGKAVDDFRRAADRLRNLGVSVPNVKLKVDITV